MEAIWYNCKQLLLSSTSIGGITLKKGYGWQRFQAWNRIKKRTHSREAFTQFLMCHNGERFKWKCPLNTISLLKNHNWLSIYCPSNSSSKVRPVCPRFCNSNCSNKLIPLLALTVVYHLSRQIRIRLGLTNAKKLILLERPTYF